MFCLPCYDSSSKYLTKASKHPAASVKEDDASPSPIRGSFRLINPHRYFVKLQILDEELWVLPEFPSLPHIAAKSDLTAKSSLLQNPSLLKVNEVKASFKVSS